MFHRTGKRLSRFRLLLLTPHTKARAFVERTQTHLSLSIQSLASLSLAALLNFSLLTAIPSRSDTTYSGSYKQAVAEARKGAAVTRNKFVMK